jgi:predicted transcriptional regulator
VSKRSGRGTARQTIRVDELRWERLGEIAEKRGTDRSALIRDKIDQIIEEDDAAEPRDT